MCVFQVTPVKVGYKKIDLTYINIPATTLAVASAKPIRKARNFSAAPKYLRSSFNDISQSMMPDPVRKVIRVLAVMIGVIPSLFWYILW